jgi:hypothetical protein
MTATASGPGLTTNCPAAALPPDYYFSTWDVGYLQANFYPAIFEALPLVWLPDNTCVERRLVDHIVRQRSMGVSLGRIAAERNEAVASRWGCFIQPGCPAAVRQRAAPDALD